MNDASHSPPPRRWLSVLLNTFLCLLIVGAATAAVVAIYRTEPKAEQINATRKSAALVETVIVERGAYSPRLVVLGSVEPAQEIVLSPRISGPVVDLSPDFVPGGMVRRGDALVMIDKADFENALSIRESELEQAQADLEIEGGRQILARKELELLGDTIKDTLQDTNMSLVLREPQLASLKAQVSVAKAAVDRANLDLDRTTVLAPFDAQVLDRSVNVGSQVARGEELGRLVGIEEYWVMAAVPVRSLRWIQFPDDESEGSAATLKNTDAWGPDVGRTARVERMIGTLDRQTRLARVLISAKDPLGLKSGGPALILDTLIEVEIEGRPIENVVRLDRAYVRERDTVWVMKEDKLEIRDTEIVYRDPNFAYVRAGLEGGDEVVTSTLATVADGVGLRRIEEAESTDGAVDDGTALEGNVADESGPDPGSDAASGEAASSEAGPNEGDGAREATP